MKWFEVDYNAFPHHGILVAKPGHEEWWLAYHALLPEIGEKIMAFTLDDSKPFGFEARVVEIEERETFWIVNCELVKGRPRYEFVPVV